MALGKARRKASVLALVLGASVAASGCASTSTTPRPPNAHSLAHQSAEGLASLQEDAPPKANDPLVASIERETIALMPYCKTSPEEIDSLADAALENLKNHGIKESAPHVLSELLAFYTHADAPTRKTTCSQASAVYLTLREAHGDRRVAPAAPAVKRSIKQHVSHSTQEQRIKHLEEENEEQRTEREEEKTDQYVKEQNEKYDPGKEHEERAAEACKRTPHCEPTLKGKEEAEKPALGPTPREAEEHPGNGSAPTTASEP